MIDEVDVEAREVELGERDVLRSDHDREEEVAEHVRDRRDHEQPHHDDAVVGEQLVVRVGVDDRVIRREQLEAEDEREHAAEDERQRDAEEEHDPDPLVIGGEQPAAHAAAIAPERLAHGSLTGFSGGGAVRAGCAGSERI
jgi:hypothetical protein